MKQKILFVLCILVGLMFINAGLNKIFQYIPVPADLPEEMKKINSALTSISWLMPLIALVEIVGGILLMIPKTRALGVVMIFPVLVGITLLHIFNAPSGIPMVILLMGISIWLIYEDREKFLALIK